MKIIANPPGGHVLTWNDSISIELKAKPFNAQYLQLYKHVGELGPQVPPAGLDIDRQARCVGNFTKTPITLRHEVDELGRTITYWGRWMSRKGETGPWSLAASMIAA